MSAPALDEVLEEYSTSPSKKEILQHLKKIS
jgi:hypothetical protein